MTKTIQLITFIILTFGSLNLHAQDLNALRKKHYNLENSLAIQGYDAVSYFSSKPVKGNKQFSYNYGNVIYYFSSQINLDLFKGNPNKYEPQYGGWCAYAMGNTGEKVEVDPKTYKIIGGKLYLFYNKYFTNTLKTWNEKEASLLPKANTNWSKLFK